MLTPVLGNLQKLTFISFAQSLSAVKRICEKRWRIGKGREREIERESMQSASLDDDEENSLLTDLFVWVIHNLEEKDK